MAIPTEEEWSSHYATNHVLIAEDEEHYRNQVKTIAMVNGFMANAVSDPDRAWEILTALDQHKLPLLITDNSMPMWQGSGDYDYGSTEGLSLLKPSQEHYNEGLQLIRRIRNTPELADMDIIMYSGAGVGEQADAFDALYVSKQHPYALNELLRERSSLFEDAEIADFLRPHPANNPRSLGHYLRELRKR